MSANRLFWKCLIKKQQINLCEKRWKYSLKKKLFFRERRLITSDWNINLCFFAYWDLVERTLLHEHQSFISNRIGCTHETFLATCVIVGLMWICMRCAFSGFLILLLPSVAVNHNLHIYWKYGRIYNMCVQYFHRPDQNKWNSSGQCVSVWFRHF